MTNNSGSREGRAPSGVVLRELRESDAERVAALYRLAFGDQRPIDPAEIVSWLHNEELKPEWLRVLELEGCVVGYGDLVIDYEEVALDAAATGDTGRRSLSGPRSERARSGYDGSGCSFRPSMRPRS